MKLAGVKRLKALKDENRRVKQLLRRKGIRYSRTEGSFGKKVLMPPQKRQVLVGLDMSLGHIREQEID